MENAEKLIAECKRIEQFSKVNSATHFVIADEARSRAIFLGAVPVIVGTAIAGVAMSSPSLLSGAHSKWFALASLLAGVLSSLLAYLNPDKERADHFLAATRYKRLENEARRAHEVFISEMSRGEFVLYVKELSRRYDELGESSPQTTDSAYQKANKKTKAGTYEPGYQQ